MENNLKFFFDKEGDVLDIAIGEPTEAISKELENDVIMRLDPKTEEIVGFTILNFEKRFEHLDSSETLPIVLHSHISVELLKLKDNNKFFHSVICHSPLIVKSSMSLTCGSTGLKGAGCRDDKIELPLSK